MIKTRRNYSFKKAGNKLVGIIAETLTAMARYQNESIQRGIDTQTDIKGSKFAKLSTASTLPIRNRRGHGFTPLSTMKMGTVGASGRDFSTSKSLRATKMVPATRSSMESKVIMINEHGIYHNEGFTTGGKSMIPGKKVPKREWFGITKEMEKGGKQYETFVSTTLINITQSIKK
ncbi:hypothetical protein CMI37_22020 [Candidatus Pacearchaeota archaeon]|nr:hypothetical protein [Candidatus Pacearchaeota archaeon]